MSDATALFRDIIRDRIGLARGGDRGSALWLLEEYCRELREGALPMREIAVYFGTAFADILDAERDRSLTDKEISEALNLRRPAKRPSTRNDPEYRNRDMLIAALVLTKTRAGISEIQAITTVGDDIQAWTAPWLTRGSHGKSRYGKVRDCWDQYGDELRAMPADWVQKILGWESWSDPPRHTIFAADPDFGSTQRELGMASE